MPDRAGLLAAALGHAARGWPVFPLRPDTRPHDPDQAKRPAFPDHAEDRCPGTDPRCHGGHTGWEPRATTEATRIERAWSRTPYNIGIACGPARLVVIDLDLPKPETTPLPGRAHHRDGLHVFTGLCREHGQPLPDDTYTVATGSGGRHLYYRHPPGPPLRNTAGRLGPLIDTRACGGYVLAAGSSVGGRPYRLLHDRPPVALPAWITDLLRPAEAVTPRRVLGDFSAFRRGAYLRAAVEKTLDRLAAAQPGRRNAALYMAAQTLGQLAAAGALTAAEVTEALTPTALTLGLTERETGRTIRSGLTAGARRPRRIT